MEIEATERRGVVAVVAPRAIRLRTRYRIGEGRVGRTARAPAHQEAGEMASVMPDVAPQAVVASFLGPKECSQVISPRRRML